MEDISLDIEFKMHTSVPYEYMSPESYITFIKGDIKAYDDETESPVLIGKIQLYYCDMLSACIVKRSAELVSF